MSDTGPSYATRRQEAFNALTQIAAQNKEFMGIAGDILWKVADFPEAQVLAQRWRKLMMRQLDTNMSLRNYYAYCQALVVSFAPDTKLMDVMMLNDACKAGIVFG